MKAPRRGGAFPVCRRRAPSAQLLVRLLGLRALGRRGRQVMSRAGTLSGSRWVVIARPAEGVAFQLFVCSVSARRPGWTGWCRTGRREYKFARRGLDARPRWESLMVERLRPTRSHMGEQRCRDNAVVRRVTPDQSTASVQRTAPQPAHLVAMCQRPPSVAG